jgi:hypothetical protein
MIPAATGMIVARAAIRLAPVARAFSRSSFRGILTIDWESGPARIARERAGRNPLNRMVPHVQSAMVAD